jgi:hypothetical protein
MSNSGWIKLYRQIRHHRSWRERRRFSNFEAWVDLLLSASHKTHPVSVGTEVVLVRRGQVLTSQVELAERWRWNRETVSRYLKQYLSMGEISDIQTSKQTSTGYTLITIRNYGKYQDSEDEAIDIQPDIRSDIHSSIQQASSIHNQEWKEGKEDKYPGAKAPEFSPIKRSRKNGRAAPAEPEAFTRWYEAFPRHEARADALKAWIKLNPDSILVDTIMAATVRYATAKAETEKQFIKTPPAWLNGKRWEDEDFSRGNGNSQDKPIIIGTDEASDSFGLSDGTRINRGTYRRMYG